MSGNPVSEDHCTQVSQRIEGKVDRLIEILEPKLEMIVRIDTLLGFAKWAFCLVFSGGFIFGFWKLIDYIRSLAEK